MGLNQLSNISVVIKFKLSRALKTKFRTGMSTSVGLYFVGSSSRMQKPVFGSDNYIVNSK